MQKTNVFAPKAGRGEGPERSSGARESKGYIVYIARMKDGRLYVGHTNNIHRRADDHARGDGSKSTRIFGFDKVVHTERYTDRGSAVKRERQLKGWSRAKKLALASGHFQELKELSRSHRRGSSCEDRP